MTVPLNENEAAVLDRSSVTLGVTRGVSRFLRERGYSVLREFHLKSKRRADIAALDPEGKFLIVEVKSSLDDFRSDQKWQDYIAHCDEFYFAVAETFPIEELPQDCGLIVADDFGAAIIRNANTHQMNGNRRRFQVLKFARAASDRLERHLDTRASN